MNLKELLSKSWYQNWLNMIIRLAKFLAFSFVVLFIYEALLTNIFTKRIHIISYIGFWLLTAYIVLPRINRRLSKLYVPDYFIGRTKTGDGLLGDPINLAVNGDEEKLILTMESAGWIQAEPLSIKSSFRIVTSSILGRSYYNAPVSSLFLFGIKQDYAFQMQDGNNPRKRHHVRFWKTPDNWLLPGGSDADWLGAATYDKNVGLSLFTGQITHKINADVDVERDFLLQSLKKSDKSVGVRIVKNFTTSYHGRNGGGDMIHTDGSLPFITIS